MKETMKERLLTGNGYLLITVGSGMMAEGSNVKLGIIYTTIGIFLTLMQLWMTNKECEHENKKKDQ